MDMSLGAKAYIKVPKCTGSTKKFPVWKKKMCSFYAQSGCGDMVAASPDAPPKLLTAAERSKLLALLEVEKDDDKKTEMKQHLKYCMQNDKAYGYLASSIDTSTEQGQYIYDVITNFQDEEFPGGQFEAAWKKLCKIMERKDQQRVLSYEDWYFKNTFEDNFHPGGELLKFDQKQKDMNRNIEAGRNVDEKQFIQHVLAKLPQGRDGEVNPYQTQCTFINQKIELMKKAGQTYDIDDLTFDLSEVYNNLHPDSSDSSSDGGDKKKRGKKLTKAEETGLAVFGKQPKKKCNNCGAWGHLSKHCKGCQANYTPSNFGRTPSMGGCGGRFGHGGGGGYAIQRYLLRRPGGSTGVLARDVRCAAPAVGPAG